MKGGKPLAISSRKKRKEFAYKTLSSKVNRISYGIPEKRAQVPFSEGPMSTRKSQLVKQLKLSQRIGLLLFSNKVGSISESGLQRLFIYQSKSSIEALYAGVNFCRRLEKERKLQYDFKPHIEHLNSQLRVRAIKKHETSRIGIGYRDKGTLANFADKLRKRITEEGSVHKSDLYDVPQSLLDFIAFWIPSSLVDEEWIDLGEIRERLTLLSLAFSGSSAL
jgi:hypothetical protein